MESGSSAEEAVKAAYKVAGPRVPATKNDSIAAFNLKFDSMSQMIDHCYSKITTANPGTNVHIAEFIYQLLKNPLNILADPSKSDDESAMGPDPSKFTAICRLLQYHLVQFPFVLVIDEAHRLAETVHSIPDKNVTVTGFQSFRRAISYLKPGTPLFVLTLGTKSVINDMNPPHLDSFRGGNRLSWPAPIVFSGNFDIHKHDQGSSYFDFIPSFETLKNPLVFKMLASMGSAIWSSIPFSGIVNLAVTKLKNSTQEKHEDAFVSWLIRTGMFANPKSAETEALVAHRMADLFNLQDDLKTMSVFYPAQPILGMAARKICGSPENGNIFQSLALNSTLLDIDRGELAESMAFMTTMLAVDRSQNVADKILIFSSYVKSFIEIMKECPLLESIWRKDLYILEPEAPLRTGKQNFILHRNTNIVRRRIIFHSSRE
jgi:hypothetical protein